MPQAEASSWSKAFWEHSGNFPPRTKTGSSLFQITKNVSSPASQAAYLYFKYKINFFLQTLPTLYPLNHPFRKLYIFF